MPTQRKAEKNISNSGGERQGSNENMIRSKGNPTEREKRKMGLPSLLRAGAGRKSRGKGLFDENTQSARLSGSYKEGHRIGQASPVPSEM